MGNHEMTYAFIISYNHFQGQCGYRAVIVNLQS